MAAKGITRNECAPGAMQDEYGSLDSSGEIYVARNFLLECGETLEEAHACYNTYGTLNEAKDNAIVVCHALTGNSRLDQWWGALLGPGKAFDTTKYFIVCANVLGSCYGSTGPRSTNPSTGGPYGNRFPKVTIRDSVRLHMRMLREHLGVLSIFSVVGGSMGGMQALEWLLVADEPDESSSPSAGTFIHNSNSNSNNNNTNSSSSVSYAEPSEEVKGTVSPTGQQAGEMLPTAPEATGAGAVYVADDFNNINNNFPMDAGGEVSAASASAVPPTHHTSPAASVVMAAAAYSPLGETNTNNNDTNDDSNSNNVDKSPPYVRSAVIIGCGVAHTAWQIAIGETQRQAIYADPKWNGGDIDFCDGPDSGLSVARQIAMVSYRSALSYQLKFGRDTCDNTGNWQVRNYLEYQGKKFLDRFDALTYVRLTQIMDTHDVGRGRGGVQAALSAIRSKVLVMGIDSDVLYPVSEQQELSALIPTSTMKIIRTNNGHDGFLLEQQQVADGITSLLSSMEE
mmetsp:Transcript_2641/g.4094  ORF Transcript_2641/g.4094 Transcript_2641/m.4094 type:complete len:511 (+) Transcript_2641:542-2074(+)|eukprot:CAMPEP_0174981028 /NCGR_PEP_ID=MMETSP0004_2-20121128/15664_1 /TAXON_ID=420556 /ORGANISM="Ochromonas sp., Strain CCMP1393" /LENGTH=510 /DNA_ID=CAMNT_0016232731 /DNA_START=474 /DNA_END=2006 /DNA_ORIENTATION=+